MVAVAFMILGAANDHPGPMGASLSKAADAVNSGSAFQTEGPSPENPSPSPGASVSLPPVTTASAASRVIAVPPSPASTATSTAQPPTEMVYVPPPIAAFDPTRTCEAASPGANSGESSSPQVVELDGGNPASLAIAVSQRLYPCADHVIVAHPADLHTAAVAAQLAVLQSAPFLYYLSESPWQEELAAELERLAPRQIWMMAGVPRSLAPAGTEVVRLPSRLEDLMGWIEFFHPTVGTGYFPVSDHRSLHSLVMMGGGLGMVLSPFSPPSAPPSDGLVMGTSTRPLRSPRLWAVDPDLPFSGLVVAAAAYDLGEGAVYWDPEEEAVLEEAVRPLVGQVEEMEEMWIVGEMPESERWLLETTLWGEELPGGGHILFPHRRLVAFYGAVNSSKLGVLGEQRPAETVKRLAPYLEDYAADGIMTIPTFEIITTLATSAAGADGDYSGEYKIDTVMPWVEYAAQNGAYVVLDLQPGRSDFLSQAKQYEELLKLPHVGLALDPEWRLGPNEVHLIQIGSVDGSEVNTVVDWLADLVRRERLPQKLLIVHQFRTDMIPNRDLIRTPPELAVMIHMDGQGGLGAKYSTWNVITRNTEDREWWWGWKNFFDEDFPTPKPQQVLDLKPTVYFVSYQ